MKIARQIELPTTPSAAFSGRPARLLALLVLAGATFFAGQQVAQARSGDQVVGTLLGAGVGALVGQQFNGQDGAIIGSIVGAVAGSAIAHDARRQRVQYQSGYRDHSGYRGNSGHRGYRPEAPPRIIVSPPRYVTPVYQAPVYRAPVYQAPPRVVYRNPPVQFVQPGFGFQPGHRAGHGQRQAQRAYDRGFRDGVRYGQWHR